MAKPKIVCVAGSVVLTAILLYASALLLIVSLALAIQYGWVPEPPPHAKGGIVDRAIDIVTGMLLVLVTLWLYRALFLKCYIGKYRA